MSPIFFVEVSRSYFLARLFEFFRRNERLGILETISSLAWGGSD